MKEKNGLKAEVAGAGFAGLVAATTLAQQGWDVTLHERGEEMRPLGAGIVLWNNSLQVLKAIDAYDTLLPHTMVPPYYETRIHNESVSKEDFDGLPWRTMTRRALHEALADAAIQSGVKILVNSEVVAADPAGSLTLASGEVRHADLIVGADGVTSQVRDSIGFEQERTRSKDGVTRLIVPRCKEELGGGDEWDNVIDFWNFEPRVLRVLYVPCNEDELYIALMAPIEDEEGSAIPVNYDVWVESHPYLAPVLREAAKITEGRYDGYQTNVLKNWSNGRVALVGDSAHAMCPALAQGAGTAMTNAYTMAMAVSARPENLPETLVAWEAEERGITDRCQAKSAWYAETRNMSKGNQFTPEVLETAAYDPTEKHVNHV
ncbi:FAD-dependent oxidoreductase [Leucobacter denitrificans]|uniref:FAD-dependent monooxygenase n=1 Tax=Leucobacter denitrificans TaxID=683042 RepID=A0A7G9S384_9MICO|nr:NAD(P)/FAD-dependent oxidoreductase [Leucobacter denitrificans]QNN62309.1 FAD-dependent monooxygenase [Leucobacter denitrificans]